MKDDELRILKLIAVAFGLIFYFLLITALLKQ